MVRPSVAPPVEVGPAPTPLPGLVGFTRALGTAGVAVDAHRVEAYLRAADCLDLVDPANLYWAGRLTLCTQPDDLPHYDDAFTAWFTPDGQLLPRMLVSRPKPVLLAGLTNQDAQPPSAAEAGQEPDLKVAASDLEVLRHKDFRGMTGAEREHLRQLFARLTVRPPRRRALRYRPARRGQLDPRRTLRSLVENGGEPARLRRRARHHRPRKLVLLIDVSGSMSPYADALLRFAHVLSRGFGPTAEVFTLGTRLTRVSRQLRQRDPEQALALAARAVPDYAGGTRLGDGLRVFLDRWGQRGAARRAVVVVFSDGWERGDPALLGEQLVRLSRLAHAVFWVNPHAGNPDYRPVQSGISVALPHLRRLLAGHSLAAMETLLREIRDA
ncbi:MAG TPA: VWA domain-containing protein [Pseudonocardiaceae bacterium]|jgi:hypothetical protein|nr:VWA domain-containing protein [Pseudonocardiaceae bacterium]